MFKNLNLLCGFIAHKLVQYVAEHNPEYIASHKLFTEANVQGELNYYFYNIIVFVLIPIMVIFLFKLFFVRQHKGMNFIEYLKQKKNNPERFIGMKQPLFSKGTKLVFAFIFFAITAPFVANFIDGYKPMEFKDGMKMEYLEYQPGNQEITDEIVGYAAKNVVPEILEAGEKALEVLSDPKTSNELIEEMTGVNPNEITKDLSKNQ